MKIGIITKKANVTTDALSADDNANIIHCFFDMS